MRINDDSLGASKDWNNPCECCDKDLLMEKLPFHSEMSHRIPIGPVSVFPFYLCVTNSIGAP